DLAGLSVCGTQLHGALVRDRGRRRDRQSGGDCDGWCRPGHRRELRRGRARHGGPVGIRLLAAGRSAGCAESLADPPAHVPEVNARTLRVVPFMTLALVALAAPWLAPSLLTQLTFLWLMVVFALTWDVMGGQTGYNSFGNILFFGIGAYTCAI